MKPNLSTPRALQWLLPTRICQDNVASNLSTKAFSQLNYETPLPLRGLCRVRVKRGQRIQIPKAHRGSFTDTETDTKTLKHKPDNQKVGKPFDGFLDNISDTFKADELGWEISLIVFPAIVSLAAEPIASLVDTAFIGQIGPVELAAVGVSISIFNIVSKLFNIPLLNVTTSFVAEDEATRGGRLKALGKQAYSVQGDHYARAKTGNSSLEHKDELQGSSDDGNYKLQLPAVSTALVIAAGLGVAEAAALVLGADYFLNIMGVPAGSPMHLPAEQYLSLRSLGAPAVVVSLAVQGVFRGFKDTQTPLYATGVGSIMNAAMDPIFMFTLGFGVSGAAVTTVVSEYFIAFVLLWNLNKKVILLPPKMEELRFGRYLKSGGLLIGRTVAVLVTFTLGTSMAARQGAIPMAAHQICLQVWLAVSLLTDSLALSGQALIADAVAKRDYKKAKKVAHRVLQIGLGCGLALAVILFAGFVPFSKLFINDTTVLEIMASGVLFVAGTQPINALAFVFDGLHYGVSDFAYAAYSMIVVGTISSTWLVLAPPILGLAGVWAGLALFMGLRMAAGFWRLGRTEGPWQFLTQDREDKELEVD